MNFFSVFVVFLYLEMHSPAIVITVQVVAAPELAKHPVWCWQVPVDLSNMDPESHSTMYIWWAIACKRNTKRTTNNRIESIGHQLSWFNEVLTIYSMSNECFSVFLCVREKERKTSTNGLYYLETELCIGVSIETGVLYLIWGKKRKKKCFWIITMILNFFFCFCLMWRNEKCFVFLLLLFVRK